MDVKCGVAVQDREKKIQDDPSRRLHQICTYVLAYAGVNVLESRALPCNK